MPELESDYALLGDDFYNTDSFYVITFLEKDGVRGFKISGIYKTEEEATSRIKEIQEYQKHMDSFIGTVGSWLEFNPTMDKCEKQNYGNEKVDELMEANFNKTRIDQSLLENITRANRMMTESAKNSSL